MLERLSSGAPSLLSSMLLGETAPPYTWNRARTRRQGIGEGIQRRCWRDETWKSQLVRKARAEQTNCVRETPTHFLYKLTATGCQHVPAEGGQANRAQREIWGSVLREQGPRKV